MFIERIAPEKGKNMDKLIKCCNTCSLPHIEYTFMHHFMQRYINVYGCMEKANIASSTCLLGNSHILYVQEVVTHCIYLVTI